MESHKKETYSEPVLTAHELLRDITGQKYREKERDKFSDKSGVEN
ncbi:hypothetical protein W02_39800 [Nitrospira sp. KM1]|nr:hypothetical protein [Nitrospira sp. KM1]BCA56840.1 hypothetical protein W02_39800 [Nitrospira sp. KM1]